jgi:hypothetical protein
MKTILVSSIAVNVWDLLSQVPINELLIVVSLVCVLMLVVLCYEPACSRLIRIIKAISEVQRPKER